MEKYKSLIMAIPFLFIGFYLCLILEPLWRVEKVITITLEGDQFSFESNVNREGDRYSFVLNKDTVSQGIVENGEWVGFPQK